MIHNNKSTCIVQYKKVTTTMGQLISGLNLRPGDALVPELGFDLESKVFKKLKKKEKKN